VRGPGPVLRYTSARLAVFVVVAAVLALLGMRGILLLLVAVLVSGLLSFVLLSRQRDAMSASVVQRGASLRQRMKEATEAEDEADDAMRAESEHDAGTGDAPARTAEPGPLPSGQRQPDPDQDGEG
jgi:ABC-type transport system involved in cytochrome bd biosynthesis fused ATPase/permease subunit